MPMRMTALAHEPPSTTSLRCWTQLPEDEVLDLVVQLAVLKGNAVLLQRLDEVLHFAPTEFESAPAHDPQLPRKTKRTSTTMPNFRNTPLQTHPVLLGASVGAARLLLEIPQLELALVQHPVLAGPVLAPRRLANASHPPRSSASSAVQAPEQAAMPAAARLS